MDLPSTHFATSSGGRRKLPALIAFALTVFCPLAAFAEIYLEPIGRYATNLYDESAAEIPAFDPTTDHLFVVNANSGQVDVLDLSDPANPTFLFSIAAKEADAGEVNSVAVKNGLIAMAVAHDNTTSNGWVEIYNTNNLSAATAPINTIAVGALPDMVTFSPNGNLILVANEGETAGEDNDPRDADNPNGSVSIIDISGGVGSATTQTVDFTSFNGQEESLRNQGVLIFPGNNFGEDAEPEYIAVSPDGNYAFVALQENSTVAKINLNDLSDVELLPLGFKDHSLPGNELDASDRDGEINIRNWPVLGMYMPDAIATYEVSGTTYFVTANEGDARGDDGVEAERIKNLDDVGLSLDPTAFPNASDLEEDEAIGRLETRFVRGDTDGDDDLDQIYVYGGRSFSIYDEDGNQVFDSGADFEKITAAYFPCGFNSSNDANNDFDSRSDAKGPEPEGVTIAEMNGRTYAFILLERVGGIMVYDITDPNNVTFESYTNNRNFDPSIGEDEGLLLEKAGDLGPEASVFVNAADSPNGNPLLIVANEVSGSTTIFEVRETFTLQLLHASDLEGGTQAIGRAPNFTAIVETLEDDYLNTVILSAGDNYIPGAFFSASGDRGAFRDGGAFNDFYNSLYGLPSDDFDAFDGLREGNGRVDISIMNAIGFDASAVGNHEFDQGSDAMYNIIAQDFRGGDNGPPGDRWLGAQFPYLSANLDFSTDLTDLAGVATTDILPQCDFITGPAQSDENGDNDTPKIAPATVIDTPGGPIGVVGATTQLVDNISSPTGTSVIGEPNANDMAQLAGVLNPVIADLRNGLDGVPNTEDDLNKIILVSHLQQFPLEQALAPLLNGVDIIVAGGSDFLLADDTDVLRGGDTAGGNYPFFTTNAEGDPVAIVSTAGEYKYVGRLVIDFDAAGNIIPGSVMPAVSGAYATTDAMVDNLFGEADPFAEGTRAKLVQDLVGIAEQVVLAKDQNIFGFTEVYIEGRREQVRTQETNFGNLSADANLWVARQVDPSTLVSIKNGGGIRSSIGEIMEVPAGSGNYEPVPPQANPLTGRQAGEISQLAIEDSLRFNNALSLLTLSIPDLKEILEHGVAGVGPGQTPGSFAQLGGVSIVYLPDQPAGERVKDVILHNGDEDIILYDEGVMVAPNPNMDIRIVTLSFLADGNDGYDFDSLGSNRQDLAGLPAADVGGAADFAQPGTEQDALAEYLAQFYPDATQPFDIADTPAEDDQRIQANLYGFSPSTGHLILYTEVSIDPSNGSPSILISGLPSDAFVQGGFREGNNWRIYLEEHQQPQFIKRLVQGPSDVDMHILIYRDSFIEPDALPEVDVQYDVPEPQLILGPKMDISSGDFEVLQSENGMIFGVRLKTEPGSQYVINYRNNLQASATEPGTEEADEGIEEGYQTPPFTAGANYLQWWDSGPPYTISESPDQRFYMSYQKVLGYEAPQQED